MKQRLTINEVDNLISMLLSSDSDTFLLALSIILAKSFKTTKQLNTAIYNARVAYVSFKEYFKKGDDSCWNKLNKADDHRKKCIAALERYKKKIRA